MMSPPNGLDLAPADRYDAWIAMWRKIGMLTVIEHKLEMVDAEIVRKLEDGPKV